MFPEEKERVEYICTDMYENYRRIIHTFFKHSTHIVDHFHVVKMIDDQLNSIRKQVMRKYANDKNSYEYRLLKRDYKILLKNAVELNIEDLHYHSILGYTCNENQIKDEMLKLSDKLRKAYALKQMYQSFDSISKKATEKTDLRARLEDIINRMYSSGISEF